MTDFSIEIEAERVLDTRSRTYFKEVLSSFVNGYYRSAAVMLWSVVVADLVFKLQSLRDLYSDPAAISILQEIENFQSNSPNNPEWELSLVDAVNERIPFFEVGEHLQIVALQKLRHLSAHPVLSSADLLYQPNKETVRAAMRNALEAVLLKPSIFSRKMVGVLVQDLAARQAVLPDQRSLRLYVENKYLQNVSAVVKLDIIKALWKFCFRLSNTETDTNRGINLRTLKVFFARDPFEFASLVRANIAYFSDISPGGEPLKALVNFLAECPSIYPALDEPGQVAIRTFAKSDMNLHAIASFLYTDATAHMQEIFAMDRSTLVELSEESWNALLAEAAAKGVQQNAYRIGIKVYAGCSSYSGADLTFARFIRANLASFDESRMLELLAGIEANQQTYGRGMASIDHPPVKQRAETLGINLAPYPKFTRFLPGPDDDI